MGIKDLNEEIKNCNKCRLSSTRMNSLCGEGDLNAKIMLVAQAPGENEDRIGEMFIGPTGKVLDELLIRVNVDRKEIYMTNLIKCMLPKYRKPKENEIKTCAQYLDREIEIVNPDVIATLGYFAAKYIFKKFSIEEELDFPDTCGQFFSVGNKKVISLRHPTALLRDDSNLEIMVKNYGKLKKYTDF